MTGNLGAYGRYQALPFLQVQLDLLYDATGGGRKDFRRDFSFLTDGFVEDDDLINYVSYINRHVYLHTVKTQLSARLGLPELQGAAVEPKFIVGASAAYIFRGLEKRDVYYVFDDGSRVISSNEKEEVGGDYQSFNFSLMGGIALDFNLPNNEVFTISFTYHRGLADLNSIEIGQPENIEDLRLQRFCISFSYSIFNR